MKLQGIVKTVSQDIGSFSFKESEEQTEWQNKKFEYFFINKIKFWGSHSIFHISNDSEQFMNVFTKEPMVPGSEVTITIEVKE